MTKAHRGMPQQRRRVVGTCVLPESRDVRYDILWCNLEGEKGERKPEYRAPSGVPLLGGGKEASMSDIEPERRRSRFSGSPKSSMFCLLAVLPRSRFAASLVALLIRSGRLVLLPRASVFRTASRSSEGGRWSATIFSFTEGPCEIGRSTLAYRGDGCRALRSADEARGDLDLEMGPSTVEGLLLSSDERLESEEELSIMTVRLPLLVVDLGNGGDGFNPGDPVATPAVMVLSPDPLFFLADSLDWLDCLILVRDGFIFLPKLACRTRLVVSS